MLYVMLELGSLNRAISLGVEQTLFLGVSIYLMVIAIDMFKGVNLCIRTNSRIT